VLFLAKTKNKINGEKKKNEVFKLKILLIKIRKAYMQIKILSSPL